MKTLVSLQLTRSNPFRCNEHPLSGPPVPCIDDEIANRPGFVINDEVLNVTDGRHPWLLSYNQPRPKYLRKWGSQLFSGFGVVSSTPRDRV